MVLRCCLWVVFTEYFLLGRGSQKDSADPGEESHPLRTWTFLHLGQWPAFASLCWGGSTVYMPYKLRSTTWELLQEMNNFYSVEQKPVMVIICCVHSLAVITYYFIAFHSTLQVVWINQKIAEKECGGSPCYLVLLLWCFLWHYKHVG